MRGFRFVRKVVWEGGGGGGGSDRTGDGGVRGRQVWNVGLNRQEAEGHAV